MMRQQSRSAFHAGEASVLDVETALRRLKPMAEIVCDFVSC